MSLTRHMGGDGLFLRLLWVPDPFSQAGKSHVCIFDSSGAKIICLRKKEGKVRGNGQNYEMSTFLRPCPFLGKLTRPC